MFRYIRKSKLNNIIDNNIYELQNKLLKVIKDSKINNEADRIDYIKSVNRLKGGVYFLRLLKDKI